MKQILLTADYVGQQDNVKSLFLNTSKNIYLKKGSTGIGGTTAILEATDTTRIVVSPTVGMIQGKEKQNSITNPNCYYIYGGSDHSWEDFFNNPDNKVVNCTPEQIINLKLNKTGYFNMLKEMTIFVDEIHQYIPDSSYRNSMSDFLNLIFKEWKANWILSTATDNTINNVLLDVPPTSVYDSYEIIKKAPQKRCIEVIRSGNQLNSKKVLEIYNDSITRGRKLLIATNRTDLHKKISKLNGFNVINLVGQNIETKLRPVKDAEKIDDIKWDTVDIVMISSKYFAGFDIPLKVDVLIDTTPNITANLIGPNDIIQIIGRARAGVDRIILHINLNRPDISSKTLYQPVLKSSSVNDFLNNINNKISKINSNNWFEEAQIIISDWSYYSMIFAPILKISLNRYNYLETKYTNENIENILNIQSWPFNEKMNKLLDTDLNVLKLDFYRIKRFLRYKIDGIFSPDLALLFYTAILIKSRNLNIEIKDSTKPTLFYLKMNKYFKNDETWRLIYGYFMANLEKTNYSKTPKHSKYSRQELDYLEIRALPSRTIVDESGGHHSCFYKCLNSLKEKNIILNSNDKEYDKLLNRCKEAFDKEKVALRTKESLLNLIGWANLFILNEGQESYNFPLKKDREYNPLTMVPSPLRSMIKINLVEIDINHANPTFIDMILGSNIASSVYNNICEQFNVTRNEAKVIYNSAINDNNRDPNKLIMLFHKIGYTVEQCLELIDLITSHKGSVYERMTEKEREIIEGYANTYLSEVKWFRFHDAIVIRESDIQYYNLKLETTYKDVKFSFKYYNDGRPYFNDNNPNIIIEDIFDFL